MRASAIRVVPIRMYTVCLLTNLSVLSLSLNRPNYVSFIRTTRKNIVVACGRHHETRHQRQPTCFGIILKKLVCFRHSFFFFFRLLPRTSTRGVVLATPRNNRYETITHPPPHLSSSSSSSSSSSKHSVRANTHPPALRTIKPGTASRGSCSSSFNPLPHQNEIKQRRKTNLIRPSAQHPQLTVFADHLNDGRQQQ